MTKLLKTIRDAVPSAPLLIGEVVGVQGDELRIQTPDAGLYPVYPLYPPVGGGQPTLYNARRARVRRRPRRGRAGGC